MARARNIKPGIFKNEILGVADPLYTLAFEGLWVLADREGRLEDRPLRIKAETFPYRDGLDMNAILDWLQENGFIARYKHGGASYIQITAFVKHQNPHKNEPESVIPAKEEIGIATDKIGTRSEEIGIARADSLNLIPSSLIPDSGFPSLPAGTPTGPDRNTDDETKLQAACRETWEAYSVAYAARYAVNPVRNTKINGQIKQFVKRIGYTESPHVAAFFVGHAGAFYVRKSHDVGSLLADAEKLRTEWATGRMVTVTSAQQIDRSMANFNAANEAIRMLEAEGRE